MATFSKIRENYLGILFGALVAVGVFFLNPAYNRSIDMIRALPQLTTCIFGFLLTLLGIILQGDGPVIQKMRDSAKIYNRFIDYNKKIVVLSFVLSIVTLVIGYVDYSWIHSFLSSINPKLCTLGGRLVIALLAFGSIWLIVDLMTFVKLFYMLIKKSK